jgi:hypothetical protein
MKDGKQNIRYIGFECRPEGTRSLEFSVEMENRERVKMTFEFAPIFFTGDEKILVQEAAGICYAKLKDMLQKESQMAPRFLITGHDIRQYRQATIERGRPTKSGEA